MTAPSPADVLAQAEQAQAALVAVRDNLDGRSVWHRTTIDDCAAWWPLVTAAVDGIKRHRPITAQAPWCATSHERWPCSDYLAHAAVIHTAHQWTQRHGGAV